MRELPPLEALKAIISIAASHSPEVSLMHVDVFTCVLPRQGSEACAVENYQQKTAQEKIKGEIGLLKKSMYGTRDAAKQLGTRLARAS